MEIVRRRLLIIAACTGLIVRLADARPAAGRIPRIGILMFMPMTSAAQEDFRRGFREFGYVEGKNILVEWRSAEGRPDRAGPLAEELVRLRVDAIVAEFTPAVLAAKAATRTIPIIMASAGDPVAAGLVPDLAHPGGNVTGFTNLAGELSAKRLDLLRESVPGLMRIGLLLQGADPLDKEFVTETRRAAAKAGVELHVEDVRRPDDLDRALAAMVRARVDAVIVLANLPVSVRQVAESLLRYRLPSISLLNRFVEAGGLMSYGASVSDIRRRVAGDLEKILKGANPGDLPVELPTKFDLVVNRRTANALGLVLPPTLLLRADRVIE